MHFKLLIALVEDEYTDKVLDAAREAGATGATVLTNARGEGLQAPKTFFGLSLEAQRDMLLFLVEEHLSRHILEKIGEVGRFDQPGTGMVFQIDVEDVVGITSQIRRLSEEEERRRRGGAAEERIAYVFSHMHVHASSVYTPAGTRMCLCEYRH